MQTLTYHNVRLNKDGEWIGTPVKVDRCINDLVLVDDALDECMLNPIILERNNGERKEIDRKSNEPEGNDRANDDEEDKSDGRNDNDELSIDENNEHDEVRNNAIVELVENNEPDELMNDENNVIVENDETQNQADNVQSIRRSTREHRQRIKITPDEIGDCDDEKDEDYKYNEKGAD